VGGGFVSIDLIFALKLRNGGRTTMADHTGRMMPVLAIVLAVVLGIIAYMVI
jgi:hypothetical protein